MQQNRYVEIPDVITVHLGRMDVDAPNMTMPFVDYIKGCACCLICPTWPENAQRANIYAINSLALHRVCKRWYRARGGAFDITASEDDMPFNRQGCLFYSTSCLVDEMFNNYLTRQGSGEPLPARICRTRQAGSGMLCQPEVVDMAVKGSTVYDILRKYYGEDIVLAQNVPRRGEQERFLGTPLMRGASGEDIRIIKRQLNRIARNYKAIVPLSEERPDFDAPCEQAIRAFQHVFDLPVTGVLDKATWYKIKQTSAAIAQYEDDLFAQEAVPAVSPVLEAIPRNTAPKSPACNAVPRNVTTENAAMENAAQWAATRHRIVQDGKTADNTTLNNALAGNMTQVGAPEESPISDSEVRENAMQAGTLPSDTTMQNAVPNAAWSGEVADNRVPDSALPDDMTQRNVLEESPISDSDVRENAMQQGAMPGSTNAAQWDALRQRILQRGDISGSGIPSIVVPGNIIPGNTMPNIIIPGDTRIDSVISDEGIKAQDSLAGNTAFEGTAQWNATQMPTAENGTVPGNSIISDRGIATRAMQEGTQPGDILPGEIARSKTPQGYAAQWSAARQNLPPESGLPASPVIVPKSQTDHLVKIGPSVSTALPDEGKGVDSGSAVEWLRQYYGV